MAITAADLKFLPSERMTDTQDAGSTVNSSGGYPSGPVVQDGADNNVFPDVSPDDRVAGRRQIRLIYPAVLSAENSMLSGADVAVYARPTDAAVEMCAFFASGRSTYPAAYLLDRLVLPVLPGTPSARFVTAGVNNFDLPTGFTLGTDVQVGDKMSVNGGGTWRHITSLNVGAGTFTLSGAAMPLTAGATYTVYIHRKDVGGLSAAGKTTSGASAGATFLVVDRTAVRIYPAGATGGTAGIVHDGYRTENSAAGWTSAWRAGGVAPAYAEGQRVLVQHPTVTATREVAVVSRVNHHTGEVSFVSPLANSYPTGSVVTTLLRMGDLQARSFTPFYQQAWNRIFADTASGQGISPRYTGAIAMTNAGAEDDRYALVFTSATAFNLISERRGQIASGNTQSDFVPLNPYTNQPLLTMSAAAWSTGWLPGNVVRFNTQGANAGVFVARCTSPSSPGGTDQGSLVMRGDA